MNLKYRIVGMSLSSRCHKYVQEYLLARRDTHKQSKLESILPTTLEISFKTIGMAKPLENWRADLTSFFDCLNENVNKSVRLFSGENLNIFGIISLCKHGSTWISKLYICEKIPEIFIRIYPDFFHRIRGSLDLDFEAFFAFSKN